MHFVYKKVLTFFLGCYLSLRKISNISLNTMGKEILLIFVLVLAYVTCAIVIKSVTVVKWFLIVVYIKFKISIFKKAFKYF